MKKFIPKILTAFLLICSAFLMPLNAYAAPDTPAEETPAEDAPAETDNGEEDSEEAEEELSDEEIQNACTEKTGSLSWIVCPSTGLIAVITDELYTAIEDLLVVQPLPVTNALTPGGESPDAENPADKPVLGTTMNTSPIYLVWQYARSLTNVVFIILLIITIYSQLTGAGINNYGLKRILPRLIIAVILVNLSYIICALAVDISNIVGSGLRGFFTEVETKIIAGSADVAPFQDISLDGVLATVLTGGSIGLVAMGAIGGPGYIFFMLLTVLIGAVIAVISGLITIAARQALVSLLVMISPLAFVAYLLPNTEKWFTQWRQLFTRMLVFYPLFSFLFGASHLLGFALLASATSPAGIILGIAVQIFPLFFSWGLMRMSGTVLGNLYTGLRKLAAPIQRGASNWALSHAEQRRQNYLANSPTAGAHLRRYLDYRQKLRQLDTENTTKLREGLATERALQVETSWLGLDEDGNALYSRKPNRYTQIAKRASMMESRITTAQADLKNTLSAYGHHFKGNLSTDIISHENAKIVEAAMVQAYRAKNEAQADEDMMLDTYLKAVAEGPGSYNYNRLVKNAGGSLGAKGEASIMGQVIVANSTTENRRRTEARIVLTKFPIDKKNFRAFLLDMAQVNDNGFETDEYGEEIEDENYRLKPGKQHQQWRYYIGRSKIDGHEITSAEYDALSDTERANYDRVKYIDAKDAITGNTVYRVYEDDAGYMKELLADDILIGDPINNRYLTMIGAGDEIHDPGILYKYHGVASSNMNTSGYKVHDGTITPMVTAQSNMGYINSPAHLMLARLQSFNVATKPGSFFQNDAPHIQSLLRCIEAFSDDEAFARIFPDEEIMTYQNVNGFKLKGLKRDILRDNSGNPLLDDNNNPIEGWVEVGFKKIAEMLDEGDDEEVLEYRKNYIRHNILTKMVKKVVGFANRNMTPNVLESQKPDGLAALKKLVDTATDLALANEDPSLDPSQRLDDRAHLLDSADPAILKRKVSAVIEEALNLYGDDVAPVAAELKAAKSPKSRSTLGGSRLKTRLANTRSQDLDEINQSIAALEALRDELEAYDATTDSQNIADTIMGWAECLSVSQLTSEAINLFSETPSLQHLLPQLHQTIEDITNPRPTSQQDIIDRVAHPIENDPAIITSLRDAIINLINFRAD